MARKIYKVVKPILRNPQDPLDCDYYESDDVLDLVNIEDDTDRIMANPEDFAVGQQVEEGMFFLKDCQYVDDHNFGTAPFAFRYPLATKLENLGYTLKPLSSWEGDAGRFFFSQTPDGFSVGILDVNVPEIRPCHGYYGNYLKPVAKKMGLTLNQGSYGK